MSKFMALMEQLFQQRVWWFDTLLVIAVALLFTWLVIVAARLLLPRLRRTRQVWDDALVASLKAPVLLVIWGFVFGFLLQQLGAAFSFTALSQASALHHIIFIIAALSFCLSFIKRVEHKIIKRVKDGSFEMDQTSIGAVSQVLRVVMIVVVLLVGLQSMGVKISALLAFGGIGGLAIGLAAKDSLANFFGSLMVYFDRPFQVGDWVSSPDRKIEGTVQSIGWRLTKILTFDKRPIYVPNAIFSTVILENPSRMTNRRINAEIGLRYCDAEHMRDITDAIREMIKNHPDIDTEQTTTVSFSAFADSSLNFTVSAFTKTTAGAEFSRVRQDIFLNIIDIVKARGADFAFPTRTLEVVSSDSLPVQPPNPIRK